MCSEKREEKVPLVKTYFEKFKKNKQKKQKKNNNIDKKREGGREGGRNILPAYRYY